jgi:hypothetical protein
MIVGLVLPKRLSGPAQNAVRAPRSGSFQPSHQDRHPDLGQNKHVHVIAHDYPGTEFVELPFGIPGDNGLDDQIGNQWILEPDRTCLEPFQGVILSGEGVA